MFLFFYEFQFLRSIPALYFHLSFAGRAAVSIFFGVEYFERALGAGVFCSRFARLMFGKSAGDIGRDTGVDAFIFAL